MGLDQGNQDVLEARQRAIPSVYGALGLYTRLQKARFLHLLGADRDILESLRAIEKGAGTHLRAFSIDELAVAGQLKLVGNTRDTSLTTSEPWFKILSLVKSKSNQDDFGEVAAALLKHNVECNKIADAYQSRASRCQDLLDGMEAYSIGSAHREALLNSRVAEDRARCGRLDAEVRSLDGTLRDGQDISRANFAMVLMAGRMSECLGDHMSVHKKCRTQHNIYDLVINPHDKMLTKLEALGAEMNFDGAKNNAIISDARCQANDIIWSLFRECTRVLDTVLFEGYTAGRAKFGKETSYAKAVEEERCAIEKEIKTLWEEIVPVAHMVVEREFFKPFLDRIWFEMEHRQIKNAVISSYTSGVLRYMHQHITELGKRIYVLTLHHQALFEAYHFASAGARGESRQDSSLPKSQTQNPHLASDDRSSIAELLQHYLSKYGSVPIEVYSKPQHLSGEKMAAELQDVVAARDNKISTLYGQMQTLFEGAAKANLGNVEVGRAILSRRLVGDSGTGVNFPSDFCRDDEAEEAIQLMEDEIEAVRERFRSLNSKAADAPDFVLQAYVKAHKRLPADGVCDGCWVPGNLLNACPVCRSCSAFTDFIARWGEEA